VLLVPTGSFSQHTEEGDPGSLEKDDH